MKTITLNINGKDIEVTISEEDMKLICKHKWSYYDECRVCGKKKEEEFMPMPENGHGFFYEQLGVVVLDRYEERNMEHKCLYDMLNASPDKGLIECILKIKKHIGKMVRRYGVSEEVLVYDEFEKYQDMGENRWICAVPESMAFQVDQIFTPTVISSKATDEEKAYRLELIKELKKYLPINK